MALTIEETKEFITIRNHVRETVLALEACSHCKRITECSPRDYAARLAGQSGTWVCRDCSQQKTHKATDPIAQLMAADLASVTWAGLSHLHEGRY